MTPSPRRRWRRRRRVFPPGRQRRSTPAPPRSSARPISSRRGAAETVRILHRAGVPPSALHLVPGDGKVGAALVADAKVAGVAFTGSTEVARSINRALAAKDAAIAPLIAETGGINPMIVDATAVPEHVTDDVVTSAFRSAGQRCSALRLICVQEEVADDIIAMIEGAARELTL